MLDSVFLIIQKQLNPVFSLEVCLHSGKCLRKKIILNHLGAIQIYLSQLQFTVNGGILSLQQFLLMRGDRIFIGSRFCDQPNKVDMSRLGMTGFSVIAGNNLDGFWRWVFFFSHLLFQDRNENLHFPNTLYSEQMFQTTLLFLSWLGRKKKISICYSFYTCLMTCSISVLCAIITHILHQLGRSLCFF